MNYSQTLLQTIFQMQWSNSVVEGQMPNYTD